jgi:hypothetical protein
MEFLTQDENSFLSTAEKIGLSQALEEHADNWVDNITTDEQKKDLLLIKTFNVRAKKQSREYVSGIRTKLDAMYEAISVKRTKKEEKK